jgi:hypothetical protein
MSTFDATSISPVPFPAQDAQAPDLHRGIYGMPMFVTVPTDDLGATVRFWTDGLGFFELFSVPGRLSHLRRWAFQDVLAVPTGAPVSPPSHSVSFSCVLSEIEPARERCEAILPGSTTGPSHTAWNAVELEVITPENTRVVLTAAKPFDPVGSAATTLAEMGIRPSP